jgi:ATP-dependent Lon protease
VLAVPLQRRPLFPGFMAPLIVTDEALIEALVTVKRTPAPYVGLFLLKDPEVDPAADKFTLRSTDQIHSVGVLAHIQQLETGPSGAIAMMMAHRRIQVSDAVTKSPPLIVKVNHLQQEPLERVNTDAVKALCNETLSTLRDIIKVNPLFQQHIAYFARKIDVTNPYALADFAASLTTLDAKELQVRRYRHSVGAHFFCHATRSLVGAPNTRPTPPTNRNLCHNPRPHRPRFHDRACWRRWTWRSACAGRCCC